MAYAPDCPLMHDSVGKSGAGTILVGVTSLTSCRPRDGVQNALHGWIAFGFFQGERYD